GHGARRGRGGEAERRVAVDEGAQELERPGLLALSLDPRERAAGVERAWVVLEVVRERVERGGDGVGAAGDVAGEEAVLVGVASDERGAREQALERGVLDVEAAADALGDGLEGERCAGGAEDGAYGVLEAQVLLGGDGLPGGGSDVDG